MTLESNWKVCGACNSPVCAFGVGDNTLTFGKETYHADCIDLTDLDNDELIEIGSKEAMDILYARDESAYERFLSDYYGGRDYTPTEYESVIITVLRRIAALSSDTTK